MPTFAIHYNAVKQTFYIPGVSQQFVTEMSVHKCVKEPVNLGEGAFVRKGTCPRGHLFGVGLCRRDVCPDTGNGISEFFFTFS